MTRKSVVFWVLFLVFVGLDQLTKILVQMYVPLGDGFPVIPGFFDLVHAENPGAAFSMFRDFAYRHYLFLGFTVVAAWVVWDQYKRLPPTDGWIAAALGLIASGAIGNAIDRVHKQTVTDFIRVYSENETIKSIVSPFGLVHGRVAEWPSFNVADSALLVGVLIFFVVGVKDEKKAPAADKSSAASDA